MSLTLFLSRLVKRKMQGSDLHLTRPKDNALGINTWLKALRLCFNPYEDLVSFTLGYQARISPDDLLGLVLFST